MRTAGAAVLGLVLVVASCGSPRESPEEVRGIVLEVEGDLASVESFLLRTDDGEVLRVVPAPDGDFRFPLPHLHDHLRTSEPLLVELDRSYDPPRATAIQDADDPTWHGEGTPDPGRQDASEQEAATAAGQEDARSGSETHGGLDPQEPTPSASPPSGTDPEGEDEPGAPPLTTEATTTTATEETVEEPVEENNLSDGTADSQEQTGAEPVGTGGGADQEPVEDKVEPEKPRGPVIDLVIVDGKLDGGARREPVAVGDIVTIKVSGNSDDEVHVHGYDLFVDLVDGDGELTFEASIPGVFEIELESSHTLLVRLEVS